MTDASLQQERAIADRLASLRELGILTRAMPNKPSEWGSAGIENGVITLKWEKDEFSPPDSTGQIIQRVLRNWKLDLRLRNLRDLNGGWRVCDAITRLLVGFNPPHSQKMWLRSREFLGEFEGIWVFEIVAIAPTYFVEPDGDEALVPLTQIFVDDQYGGVQVPNANL